MMINSPKQKSRDKWERAKRQLYIQICSQLGKYIYFTSRGMRLRLESTMVNK
jgi:hypothetical protein